MEKKPNCWEVMNCGRGPGGEKAAEMGTCIAATEAKMDGTHGGRNGGRCCWAIAGTLCEGNIQGWFAQKYQNCKTCPFYKQVLDEEGPHYKFAEELLEKLNAA